MAGYIEFDLQTDPDQAVQDFIDLMQRIFDNWQPHESQLEMAVSEEILRRCAETAEVSVEVAAAIFRKFGAQTIGIPPLQGAYATSLTDWEMIDNAGYTIPAGTIVGFEIAGDELAYFATDLEVVIPPGSISVIGVPIISTDIGELRNGLSAGSLVLVDALGYVLTVEASGSTTGGVDEESDEEYMDRLRETLETLSPRPVLPADFVKLSRNVIGVHRARCVDLYNPNDGTFGNPRMVSMIPVQEDGTPVASGVKSALSNYLSSRREVNFIVHTADPTYEKVDIIFRVVALAGYQTADVHSAITIAISDYIDAGNWAGGSEEPPIWTNNNTIRFLELAALINSLEGVDYIAPDGLTLNGSNADLLLPGVAPLPKKTGPNPVTDSIVEGRVD